MSFISDAFSNAYNTASQMADAAAQAAQQAAGAVAEAAEQASTPTSQQAHPIVDGVIDAVSARYQAIAEDPMGAAMAAGMWVIDDEVTGNDIHTDNGKTPFRFGYGENKKDIFRLEGFLVDHTSQKDTPGAPVTHHELAAKLRGFGHASWETLSASIGIETETGYKQTNTSGDVYENGLSITEFFAGVQYRIHGEVGALGASSGIDALFGMRLNNRGMLVENDGFTQQHMESLTIGTGGSVEGMMDYSGLDVYPRGFAGIDGRVDWRTTFGLPADFGLFVNNRLNGFVGAELAAMGKIGATGGRIGADYFVGARASWRPELGIMWDDIQLGSGFLDFQGRAGFGGGGALGAYFNKKTGQLDFEFRAGAAFGVGGGVAFGFTLFTMEFDDVAHVFLAGDGDMSVNKTRENPNVTGDNNDTPSVYGWAMDAGRWLQGSF